MASKTPAKTGKELEKEKGTVARWVDECQAADQAELNWRRDAWDTWLIYRQEKQGRLRSWNEQSGHAKRSFNILWSNTQTTLPAVYSSTPQPDVRRRWKERDPISRKAALVIERCISYFWTHNDGDKKAELSVLDMLVPGRGVLIARYSPEMGKRTVRQQVFVSEAPDSEGNPQIYDDGGNPVAVDTVQFDEEDTPFVEIEEDAKIRDNITIEHVTWKDFTPLPADKWGRCRGFRITKRLTKQECIEAFGRELADELVYYEEDTQEEGSANTEAKKTKSALQRATIWEIHDKVGKQILFIQQEYKDKPLKVVEDPTGIDHFFTAPEPLYFSPATQSLVPLIPYALYKDQAEELNDVTVRIGRVVNQIKAKALYDKIISQDMSNLEQAQDGELVPAEGSAGQTKLQDGISWWPVQDLIVVLQQLIIAREQFKQTIYEITGLSDIVRGATKASETLGAQQIKARFGTLRMDNLKDEVQRFIRDLFQIMAEIIANNFDLSELQRISQVEAEDEEWAAIMQLLRSEDFRSFAIQVETDTTVQPQLDKEREEIVGLLAAVTQFMQGVAPLTESAGGPIPDETAINMLLAAVRRFRLGRVIEDDLERLIDIRQTQGPKQSPGDQAEQQKMQAEIQMKQADAEAKQQETAQKAQAAQIQAQIDQQKAAQEAAQIQMEMEQDRQQHEYKMREMAYKHQATMREIQAKENAALSTGQPN